MRRSATTPSACFPSAPVDIDCSDATDRCWVVSQGSDFIVRMDFDGTGKPTINAPTAPGPFAVSPVVRIFTIDPAERDTARGATRAASRSTPTARAATSSARRPATSSSRIWSATPSCSASALPSCRSTRLEQSDPARQDRLLHLAPLLVRPRLGRLLVVPPRRPHRPR